MAKDDLSDSDPDSERGESTEKLSEEEDDDDDDDDEEEEEEEEPRKMGKHVIPDYEKQRLSRMAENKARMEALGLYKMATSLMASPQKSNQSLVSTARKGKRKIVDEDDEYRPNDDVSADDLDVDDEEEEDEDEEDADSAVKSSAKSRRRKPQKKVTTPKNKLPLQKHSKRRDYINEDDDEDLMKAISLSLQDLPEKKNANVRDGAGGRKKPPLSSRMKMTEDELILHFFQFDESGKGFLTLRDLQRVSTAHDFLWTDEELADMISLFDSDGDGKINLDDFRKIARRCSMI